MFDCSREALECAVGCEREFAESGLGVGSCRESGESGKAQEPAVATGREGEAARAREAGGGLPKFCSVVRWGLEEG